MLCDGGIGGTAVEWYLSYLTGRKQRVCTTAGDSAFLPVVACVPQGSVLGPHLFSIYVNGFLLLPLTDCECEVFVDDTVIFARGKTATEAADKLTPVLDSIAKWFSEKNFQAQQGKTKALVLGKKKKKN